MSKKILDGLVSNVVSEFVNAERPFGLLSVLGNINAPEGVVVDIDYVERFMNKMFYADKMTGFEIFVIDDNIVYAPVLMSDDEIRAGLNPVKKSAPKVAQRHIYSLVYSPDSRGRIRFPVRLTSVVMKDGTNKVWVATNGDEIRVSSHKPRIAKSKQYSIDCYGNILMKAPADSVYEMRTGRYGTLVAKPVTM